MSQNAVASFYPTLEYGLEKYLETYPNQTRVTSPINRFILPSFGLQLSGKRITEPEQKQARLLLKNIVLKDLTRNTLMQYAESNFQLAKLDGDKKKRPRSQINKFIDFLENFGLLKVEVKQEKPQRPRYVRSHGKDTYVIDKSHLQEPPKKAKEIINLFLDADRKMYEGESSQKKVKRHLKRIASELDDFKNTYMKMGKGCGEYSINIYLKDVQRLLGWLYRKKEYPLKDLGLESLIQVVDITINVEDLGEEDLYIKKARNEFKAKKVAKNVKKFLLDFFDLYQVHDNQTKFLYINSLIALAKYLHRDITDEDEYQNYEDIAVIRMLKVLRQKFPTKKNKDKDLKFSWEEVLMIRDSVLEDANNPYFYSIRRYYVKDGDGKRLKTSYAKCKREGNSQVKDLQRFLILCLLTIIPTDRSRTIRELRIGKTLKHGIKSEIGFISKEKMANPKDAKYYIHLYPEDYKTGKTYGEFWGELPNHTFKDGSKFYDYMDRWLYQGGRQQILNGKNQNHDYVFVKANKAEPMEKDNFGEYFTAMFFSKTGCDLYPHKLRTIFRSYVDSLNVSPREKKSISHWMHHSNNIAETVYTQLNSQEKLEPGFELVKKINQSFDIQSPVSSD